MRSRTGRLKSSARVTVSVLSKGVRGAVIWNARSNAGFPYPVVQESGHKAFGPKNAKVLHWINRDGQHVFAMKVAAWPGTHFASKGLQDAVPRINLEMTLARDRIVRQIEAL